MKSLFLCAFCLVLHCFAWCGQTPAEMREAAKQGFERRWNAFCGETRTFPRWAPNWNEVELRRRYEQLCREREAPYYHVAKTGRVLRCPRRSEEYCKPKQRIKGGHATVSPSFAYNEAYPGYNASIITLDGKQFLAMEAPTRRNLKEFCEMLCQYGVTDLVRLVPFCEDGKERTAPYWEGYINVNPTHGNVTITLNGREMNYIMTDCWRDGQAIEPERLIALVKAVMANKNPQQVIAVHCHAGVGRTGTFLAAYELIRKIDEQIAHGVPADRVQVSVDRVVLEISLQRIYGVGSFVQYLSLYKLVGLYLDSLKATKPSDQPSVQGATGEMFCTEQNAGT
jgi:protein tyrosine phosphatase